MQQDLTNKCFEILEYCLEIERPYEIERYLEILELLTRPIQNICLMLQTIKEVKEQSRYETTQKALTNLLKLVSVSYDCTHRN